MNEDKKRRLLVKLEKEELINMIINEQAKLTSYRKSTERVIGDLKKDKIKLQNNWNELKNIIEQDIRQCEELIEMCPKELRNTIIGTRSYEEIIGCNKHILSKMQELQGDDKN